MNLKHPICAALAVSAVAFAAPLEVVSDSFYGGVNYRIRVDAPAGAVANKPMEHMLEFGNVRLKFDTDKIGLDKPATSATKGAKLVQKIADKDFYANVYQNDKGFYEFYSNVGNSGVSGVFVICSHPGLGNALKAKAELDVALNVCRSAKIVGK